MKAKNIGPMVTSLILLILMGFGLIKPARGTSPGGEAHEGFAKSPLFEPYLVKDIYTAGSSSSEPLVGINGKLFFIADDGTHGDELWISDGSESGTVMVRDIYPGTDNGISDDEEKFYALNDILLFAADDGVHGEELWISDGTGAGTMLLKDIHVSDSSEIEFFSDDGNGTVYFRASDEDHGDELWKTDGTPDGTVLVADIYPGSDGSWPGEGIFFDGMLYFTAYDDVHGTEFWKSNGTEGGTELIIDINPGPDYSVWGIFATESLIFLVATDGVHGFELWRSDGTAIGTEMVLDINPTGDSGIGDVVAIGDTLFFNADNGTNGDELWMSDGTSGGTHMVADIHPDAGSSIPRWLTSVQSSLFFVAEDSVNGVELWKSDGTPGGTQMVLDINPGGNGSYPYYLLGVGSMLYFSCEDGVHGVEFWQSDGTEGGTLLVKDINPGTEYSSPTDYLAVGHLLYFDAVDDTHGNELWAYQIAIPNSSPNTPSNPSPADGAVNISLTPTLSWTGGDADGDSVQYTVYGQKASDVISVVWCAASSSTSCAPSIVLEESTKYLWFVHADDGEGGQVDGPFWEFTTVGGASISYTVYLPMTTK